MLGRIAKRRTRKLSQNMFVNQTILKETQVRDLLQPILVTGSRLFDRSLLNLALERTPRQNQHSTHTGATTSVLFCTPTSRIRTCFTQSLPAGWMMLLQTSVIQLWTRERKKHRGKKTIDQRKKDYGDAMLRSEMRVLDTLFGT